jgi:predicted transcriptional regulator
MSKKRPTQPAGQGRARDRGATRTITVELDPALDDALEAFRIKDRRTKRAVVTIAIEQYLERQGAWPPAGEGGDR